MFVLTAKLNKKKLAAILLAALLALILIVLAVIAAASGGKGESREIRSAADAAAYLEALGWEVSPEPLETEQIVIPRSFSEVYRHYAELQDRQGFSLKKYGGMRAVRYSFRVLNYPGGGDGIVADLVVYGTTVIAGDIQSTALDGFMEGLRDNAPGAE